MLDEKKDSEDFVLIELGVDHILFCSTNCWTDGLTDEQMHSWQGGQRDRCTDGTIDSWEINRQTLREREKDRQWDRQTDRQR